MTLTEIIDALDDIGTQLHECVLYPLLDNGQRLMLSEAEVRVQQTRRELTQFDLPGDVPMVECDNEGNVVESGDER